MLTLKKILETPVALNYLSVARLNLEIDHTQSFFSCIESIGSHKHHMQVILKYHCINTVTVDDGEIIQLVIEVSR